MSEYEFSQDENVIIETLAKRMARVGLLMIALFVIIFLNNLSILSSSSVLSLIASINIVDSILFIVMGMTLYRPTDNLKFIVSTEGQDISELMTAFGELNNGLRAVMILLVLHFILMLFTFFFIS